MAPKFHTFGLRTIIQIAFSICLILALLLLAVPQVSAQGVLDLAVVKNSIGDFTIGPNGGTYEFVVTSVGDTTVTGGVLLHDHLPAGLTVSSLFGPGWNCLISPTLFSFQCSHDNPGGLAPSSSLPALVLGVNITASAANPIPNTATIFNMDDQNPDNNSYTDFAPYTDPTAVALSAFSVAPLSGTLVVTWETAQELDTVGFNVYRALSPDASQDHPLNLELIPSLAGGSVGGASYQLVDADVQYGVLYYYWLESVGFGDSQLYGPEQVTLTHALFLPAVVIR